MWCCLTHLLNNIINSSNKNIIISSFCILTFLSGILLLFMDSLNFCIYFLICLFLVILFGTPVTIKKIYSKNKEYIEIDNI